MHTQTVQIDDDKQVKDKRKTMTDRTWTTYGHLWLVSTLHYFFDPYFMMHMHKPEVQEARVKGTPMVC